MGVREGEAIPDPKGSREKAFVLVVVRFCEERRSLVICDRGAVCQDWLRQVHKAS